MLFSCIPYTYVVLITRLTCVQQYTHGAFIRFRISLKKTTTTKQHANVFCTSFYATFFVVYLSIFYSSFNISKNNHAVVYTRTYPI